MTISDSRLKERRNIAASPIVRRSVPQDDIIRLWQLTKKDDTEVEVVALESSNFSADDCLRLSFNYLLSGANSQQCTTSE